jgi:hypothetical protein
LIYNVSRSTSKGGPYTLVDTGMVGNTVTDQGLINGKPYYYVVSALTETGPSSNSAEIEAVPVAQGTTYEAETSLVNSGGGVFPCPQQCSAGAREGSITPGVTLTFNDVKVAASGTYKLRIYFTNGDSNPSDFGPLDVSANGMPAGAITAYPYTGDWNIPGFTTIDVTLNAGTNTIVLDVPASSSQGSPDIDRILVPFSPMPFSPN